MIPPLIFPGVGGQREVEEKLKKAEDRNDHFHELYFIPYWYSFQSPIPIIRDEQP
jgi:hypothetical protein